MIYLLLQIWPYLAVAALIGFVAGGLGVRMARRAAEREAGRRW